MSTEAEQVRTMAGQLHGGRWVELSHPLEIGMPSFPAHPQFFKMPWRMADPSESNQILFHEHTGTHVDSPSHFVPKGDPGYITVDQMPAASVMGVLHILTVGQTSATGLVQAEDLNRMCVDSTISAGDVLCFQFRQSDHWSTEDGGQRYFSAWPGISSSAAQWMVDRGVAAVGTDAPSVDLRTSTDFAAHRILLGNNVPIIENLANLSAVTTPSLFMAIPLPIRGGSGSPVRALAMGLSDSTSAAGGLR